jgi:hypothetical protein
MYSVTLFSHDRVFDLVSAFVAPALVMTWRHECSVNVLLDVPYARSIRVFFQNPEWVFLSRGHRLKNGERDEGHQIDMHNVKNR